MDERKNPLVFNFSSLYLIFLILILGSCKFSTDHVTKPRYLLHHELRMPESGISEKTYALILLHGLGSNEKDFLNIAPHLDPEFLVVCPRGPYIIAEGKYSWYPLTKNVNNWEYRANEVLESANTIKKYLDQVGDGLGIKNDHIFLGGFSQGAIMSLSVGLTAPERVKGLISLSGQLYPEIGALLAPRDSLKNLTLFVSHGTQDKVLPIGPIQKSVKELKTMGLDIEEHWYPVQHTISNQNYKDLLVWLKNKTE